MVMQYLVSRNEEYLRHITTLNQDISGILQILEVMQYNILELKTQLNQLETLDDAQKKEKWFAKQQK
jgi:hypothetical protein